MRPVWTDRPRNRPIGRSCGPIIAVASHWLYWNRSVLRRHFGGVPYGMVYGMTWISLDLTTLCFMHDAFAFSSCFLPTHRTRRTDSSRLEHRTHRSEAGTHQRRHPRPDAALRVKRAETSGNERRRAQNIGIRNGRRFDRVFPGFVVMARGENG